MDYPLITDKSVLDPPSISQGSVDFINYDDIVLKYQNLFEKHDKILIVSGDSFTHGDELADPELPGFPGFMASGNFTGLEKFRRLHIKEAWMKKKNQMLLSNLELNEQQWAKERTKSYPMLIQKERNDILVINFSRGGSSIYRNSRILREFSIYLKEKFPNKNIEVILGLSGHQRLEEITKYGYLSYLNNVSYDGTCHEGYYKCLSEMYLNHFDDKTLIERYLLNFMFFDFSMNSLGIRYHITSPKFVMDYLKENSFYEEVYNKYRLLLQDKLEPIYFVTYDDEITFLKDEKIMMPCGHYAPIVHEFLAIKLIHRVFNG